MNFLLLLMGVNISLDLDSVPKPLPIPTIDASDRIGLGSCIGQDGPVELRRALFLENRALDFDDDSGRMRAALLGQTIRIQRLSPGLDQGTYVQDIGNAVSEDGSDADVDLKFALLGGRLTVYWRESFQHRIYRQGLFLINGQSLTILCQGRAGSEVSH